MGLSTWERPGAFKIVRRNFDISIIALTAFTGIYYAYFGGL
jgi:hypothetical protein